MSEAKFNLVLPLSMINVIRAALDDVAFKHAAPIVIELQRQMQKGPIPEVQNGV